MTTRQIIERNWQEFADEFSRSHEGWLASVYVDDPFGDREYLACGVPLRGLTVDQEGGCALLFLAGGASGRQFGYIVEEPRRIVIDTREAGAVVTVCVFGGGGTATVFEFRTPVPAEETGRELVGSR